MQTAVDERLNEIDNGCLGLLVYHHWNFHYDFCGIREITYQPDHQSWKSIWLNQKCY